MLFIHVEFGGHVYQQSVGIPMGTSCAPLVTDLFMYSYEADFIDWLAMEYIKLFDPREGTT